MISEASSFFSKNPVSSRKKAKISSGYNSTDQSTEGNILVIQNFRELIINRLRSQAMLLESKNDRLPE